METIEGVALTGRAPKRLREDEMRETRRGFLASVAVLGSCLAAGSGWLAAQETHKGMPTPPLPAERQGQNNPPALDPQAAKRALLLQNEKDFRAGVERLYELTGELRDEVQKTPTTDVLSVGMYKRMEAIEKLAKQLKGKAKG
jgi:hypothetical protein